MSKELVEKFERIGVDKEFFESKLGKIESYDIEEITSSTSLRSKVYKQTIVPTEGDQYNEIIKETWPGPSVSKRLWRGIPNQSISLERNEIDFLKFATEHNAYTPKYRWDISIQDDNEIERTYVGISYDGKPSKILLSAKPEITTNFLRRTLDKVLSTGYIALHGSKGNQVGYRTKTGEGLEAVWSLDDHFIKSTVYETLENLLKYKFGSSDNTDYIEWLGRYGFKNIAEILSGYLIKTLTKEPADFPLPLTLHLGNILVGSKPIPEDYNPDVIYKLAEGEGDVSGDSIVITDYRRIGWGSEAILEQLLRHPLILQNLSVEQLDGLSEHIFIQYRKLRAIGNPQRWIPKVVPKGWLEMDKAARRLADLNKVNYNLGLHFNFPKKAEERDKIYEVRSHSKNMLSDFMTVNDTLSKKHPEVGQAFRELMPNGSS